MVHMLWKCSAYSSSRASFMRSCWETLMQILNSVDKCTVYIKNYCLLETDPTPTLTAETNKLHMHDDY